jgi:hypothetical protein
VERISRKLETSDIRYCLFFSAGYLGRQRKFILFKFF